MQDHFVRFGPPALLGNSSRNFQVYWNVPSFMCHKYGMNLEQVSKKFGILQNQNDEFRGDKIAILYDPGDFPALLKDEKTAGEKTYDKSI